MCCASHAKTHHPFNNRNGVVLLGWRHLVALVLAAFGYRGASARHVLLIPAPARHGGVHPNYSLLGFSAALAP